MATAIAPRKIALSFSGSGHLHAYQLGAAHHLLTGNHRWADRITHFAGALAVQSLLRCVPAAREECQSLLRLSPLKALGLMARPSAARQGHLCHQRIRCQRISESQTLFLSATHCRIGRNAPFSSCRAASRTVGLLRYPQAFHPFDLVRANPTTRRRTVSLWTRVASMMVAKLQLVALTLRCPVSPHGEAYVDGGITNVATSCPQCLRPHAACCRNAHVQSHQRHGCVSQSSGITFIFARAMRRCEYRGGHQLSQECGAISVSITCVRSR